MAFDHGGECVLVPGSQPPNEIVLVHSMLGGRCSRRTITAGRGRHPFPYECAHTPSSHGRSGTAGSFAGPLASSVLRERRALHRVCLSCVEESSSLCLAFIRGCEACAMTVMLMALCILGLMALAALAWGIGRAMDREEADLRTEAMHVMGADTGADAAL